MSVPIVQVEWVLISAFSALTSDSEKAGMKDNFWNLHLGDKRRTAVKNSDITTALKKGDWYSGKARNNYLSMLSRVFSLDVVDEIVMKSPCDSVEHATWQKKLQDPFTLEEVNRILDSMREHYPEPVPNFYEFTFLTGLRTSEGIGLEWTKVDWAAQTVQIEQGFPVNEIEDTKTSKVNTVNLNSGALPALQRQKAWTYLNEDPCVCLDPGTGKPWAYEQNARKRYQTPTLKRLGIGYHRPQNTRHTCATIGLMAGADHAYLTAQLRHGIEVFLRDYSKWIHGDDNAREVAEIEEPIGKIAS